MASSESEQGTGFVERGTACYSTGISGDASWSAGHNAQEVALGDLRPANQGSARSIPSFTAFRSFCLQPRYRSVVCTETCPSRN